MTYIILAILIAIIILIIYAQVSKYYLKLKCIKAANDVFSANNNISIPTIKMGTSYSYPTVEVIFNNNEDLENANLNGTCKSYEEKIQQIFSSIKDFDATRAINFTYIGHTYDFSNLTKFK